MFKKMNRKGVEKMNVNVENLKKLIAEKYRGNQSFFADEAEIERSYFNQKRRACAQGSQPPHF